MKHILWICWVAIALPFQTFAQETADDLELNDTLVIKMSGKTQVRIIARSMTKIIAYTQADSVKTIFLNDLSKAISQSENKQLPLKVYYLVHESGKRRLKMKTDEYADEAFNLDAEKHRLNEDLPKHELNIYDLRKGILMQFFINDSAGLESVSELNLMSAINFALANKKEIKRFYRYDIASQMDGFTKIKSERNHISSIEVTPLAGAKLIGNVLTPIVGATLVLNHRNRYGISDFKTGIKMTGYFFTDFSGGKFNKLYSNTGYDLFFLFNPTPRSKSPVFYGLEGGFIGKTSNWDGVFKGDPAHFGFLLEYKNIGYSFGYIRYGNKQSIPTVGVRLPF